MSTRSLILLFLAPVILAPVVGCVRPATDIRGEETGVLFTNMRIQYALHRDQPGGDTDMDELLEPPRRQGSALFAELEYTQGDTDFDQQLASSEVIRIDGAVFNGPQTLDIDASVDQWNLQLRGRAFASEWVSFDGNLGVGYTAIELDIQGSPTAEEARETGFGPVAGFGVAFWPVDIANVYGRTHFAYGWGDFDIATTNLEIGVEVTPVDLISLYVGYRWQEVDAESDNDLIFGGFESDIELELEGPVFGLEISF